MDDHTENFQENGLPKFKKTPKGKPISISFSGFHDLSGNSILWHQSKNFQEKTENSVIFQSHLDINSPNHIINHDLSVIASPYVIQNKITHEVLDVDKNYPVGIHEDSTMSSNDIFEYFHNKEIISDSEFSGLINNVDFITNNLVPYWITHKLEFLALVLKGDIILIDKENFQFHSDTDLNQQIKTDYYHAISNFLFYNIHSVNHLRNKMQGYGQDLYAIWDMYERMLLMIDVTGNVVLPERRSEESSDDYKKRIPTPASYYGLIYGMAIRLSDFYLPELGDMIMKSILTPPNYFPDTSSQKYITSMNLWENWQAISPTTFRSSIGKRAGWLWELFKHRSNLEFVKNLIDSLEFNSYICSLTTPNNYPKSHSLQTTDSTIYMNGIEKALSMILAIYFNENEFPVSNPETPFSLQYRLAKSDNMALFYHLGVMFDDLMYKLSTPWTLLINAVSSMANDPFLNQFLPNAYCTQYSNDHWISEFMSYQGAQYIQNYDPESHEIFWPVFTSETMHSVSFPKLFLSQFNGRTYFGRFGDSDIVDITIDGNQYQINYEFNNELKFIKLFLQPDSPIFRNDEHHKFKGTLLDSVRLLFGSESVGPTHLPSGYILSYYHTGAKRRKPQFGDFITVWHNWDTLFHEIYGYRAKTQRGDVYFHKKEPAALEWVKNGYPIDYQPGVRVSTVKISSVYNPKFLTVISPFYDHIDQRDQLYNTVNRIIHDNPKLHFHDVIFHMGENLEDWNLEEAWVNRIQYIFGIRTDASGKFLCIANNPEFNNPHPDLYPFLFPYMNDYLSINDGFYNPMLDPFQSRYNPEIIPDYNQIDDFNNNQWDRKYMYKYWQNYFIILAAMEMGVQNPLKFQEDYNSGQYYNHFYKVLVHIIVNKLGYNPFQ